MIAVKSGVSISLLWTEFKKYIDGTYKRLSLQYTEDSSLYYIFAIDNQITYQCSIYKSGASAYGLDQNQNDADRADFEANFKPSGNKPITNYFYLKDFGELDPRNMRTMVRGFEINVVNGVNPSVFALSFPYDIWMLEGRYWGNWVEWNENDKVDAYVIPTGDGVVGVLTSNEDIGQTVLSVNSTVIDNVLPGDSIEIGSSTEHYEIISKSSSDITISPSLSQNKLANDLVKIRLYRSKDLTIVQNKNQDLGGSNFGSSKLPANYTLKIIYKHNTTPASAYKIRFNLAYQYGKEL